MSIPSQFSIRCVNWYVLPSNLLCNNIYTLPYRMLPFQSHREEITRRLLSPYNMCDAQVPLRTPLSATTNLPIYSCEGGSKRKERMQCIICIMPSTALYPAGCQLGQKTPLVVSLTPPPSPVPLSRPPSLDPCLGCRCPTRFDARGLTGGF